MNCDDFLTISYGRGGREALIFEAASFDEATSFGRGKASGDKVARALAVQATFSPGMVYAPVRDWAELLITQASVFPKGKHDDLVDSMTQAISYLRGVGLAQSDDDVKAEKNGFCPPHGT